MLFLISEVAFSAAFQISVWVLKKTCNGVAYVVSAAVAAYARSTETNEMANDDDGDHSDCVVVMVPPDCG
jgi:hypothetical protein